MADQLVAVLYKHTEWFQPLFDALNWREISYRKLQLALIDYDYVERAFPHSLIVNPLSNLANTPAILGLNPTERLVDYILE